MVSVGVTMAVFSDMTRETNIVTIGNINIKLIDVYTQDNDVTPGKKVSKKVGVENTGNKPCYVRIFIKKEWYDELNNKVDNPSIDMIEPLYKAGWASAASPYDQYDECYYYQTPLEAGDIASLFDEFKLSDDFDVSKYGNYQGHIKVYAEAVQSDYIEENSDLIKDASGNIIGWPTSLIFN